MATGTLSPTPVFTGLDDNGDPLSGGKLWTYAAGTTTKQATYTDVDLLVPNSNPVILDSAGRCVLFLTPGLSYYYELKTSADAAVWEQDNVAAVPTSNVDLDVDAVGGEAIAAGESVYLSDGTGSTTAGRWYLTDASAAATSTLPTQAGIAVSSFAEAGAAGTVRIGGRATGLAALTTGALHYLSETAGAITATPPSLARVIGVADSPTTLLLMGDAQAPLPGMSLETVTADPALSSAGFATIIARSDTNVVRASVDGGAYVDLKGTPTVVTTTASGTQADFDLGTDDNYVWLRVDNDLSFACAFGSIAGGVDGRVLIIENVGATPVVVQDQNAGVGTPANRVVTQTPQTNGQVIGSFGRVQLIYDGTIGWWRLSCLDPGLWISMLADFDAADYTASSGAWTVAVGDVTTLAYRQDGAQITVLFNLVTTTVTSTPGSLNILPAALEQLTWSPIFAWTTSTSGRGNPQVGTNPFEPIQITTTNGSGTISLQRENSTGLSWLAVTNVCAVSGVLVGALE